MLLYNIYDKQVNPISFFFSNQKTKIGLWLYKFTPQRHHLWHYLSLKNKKERFLFLGGEGLTSMLSLPLKKEATSWMSFSLWSREDASHTDPDTTKPFPSHSFKHLFSSASFLEQVYTDAPNPASSSTTACLIINKKNTFIHSFINSINKAKFKQKGFYLNHKRRRRRPNATGATGDKSGHALERPFWASDFATQIWLCHWYLCLCLCLCLVVSHALFWV